MMAEPNRCPERVTRSLLNPQTTNVSSERLMARGKLAQWYADFALGLLIFFLSDVYRLLILFFHLYFQVSTKEVIKFQMVG